jgi:hypothetical protein
MHTRMWWCVFAFCIGLMQSVAGMPSAFAARSWEKIDIPGAKCGDGAQYSIFISLKDPTKIAFDFMGNGACWSAKTCYGPIPTTWLHPIPTVLENTAGGFVSDNPDHSPVADYSIVYFPYCTGDVFFGAHVARYELGIKVHHVGRANVESALRLLTETKRINLPSASKIVLYGFSAGALGALGHLRAIAPLLSTHQEKTLLLDAPGLHFGPHFWDKFTTELLADFGEMVEHLGYMPRAGEHGNLDIVMSTIFGTRNPIAHEEDIYGPDGIYEATRNPRDNCAAWIPSTGIHTFGVTRLTASVRAGGVSAMEFISEMITKGPGRNYR